MAVDAGRYGRRWQRERAGKERRQKQILAGAAGLLVVVLAIQVPRMLHQGAPPAPAPNPAATSVPATGATSSVASTSARGDLVKRAAALRRFRGKDPFLVQAGGSGTTTTGAKPAAGPWVRTIDFVPKDPFAMRVGGRAAPAPRPASSRPRPIATRREYVVILASVPASEGRAAAARIAHRARVRGISAARVLESSAYRSLRRGFYVVFYGTYRTARDARRGAAAARRSGFPRAYWRPLSR
jgi:hypothetical protein